MLLCSGIDYSIGIKTRFIANQFWCIFIIIFAIFLILLVLLAKRSGHPFYTFMMTIPVSCLYLFYWAFTFDLYWSFDVISLKALKVSNPIFFYIYTSKGKQLFDIFMGRGTMYQNNPATSNIKFYKIPSSNYTETHSQLHLDELDISRWPWQHKCYSNFRIEPSLDLVKK